MLYIYQTEIGVILKEYNDCYETCMYIQRNNISAARPRSHFVKTYEIKGLCYVMMEKESDFPVCCCQISEISQQRAATKQPSDAIKVQMLVFRLKLSSDYSEMIPLKVGSQTN
ncbi:hypothetical protein CHARACLAT_007678 [Characodon lateralis]|uniref:Uncharacterized protein n=1 Tax=Characodon lateralis TaxID=208331 RepID=A0ABU7DPV6_9TELE|nr:hypothetical protein [Characodon lateralis]